MQITCGFWLALHRDMKLLFDFSLFGNPQTKKEKERINGLQVIHVICVSTCVNVIHRVSAGVIFHAGKIV